MLNLDELLKVVTLMGGILKLVDFWHQFRDWQRRR
jgi:hypothetical protein